MIELNKKQKRFCEEYVKDFNGTQAAIRAGYSKNSANEQSSQHLAKLHIQAYIKELADKATSKNNVTVEKIVAEFSKIAFSSIAHLHNSWISLKDFETLTDDQKDSIESIQTRVRKMSDNDVVIDVEEVKIKLYDKQRALENLGKYMGIYEADNEQTNSQSVIILPSNGRD